MLNRTRFLIVRLSSIGDVLHATPVARALKTAFPACHITWAVGAVAADILRYNPYVDDVYVWPREEWEKQMRAGRILQARKLWQILRRDFRERHFDVALDVHGLFLSGMVTLASGASRRIGMHGTREGNRLFMTEIAGRPPAGDIHVIFRYLTVPAALGATINDQSMTLGLSPESRQFTRYFLAEHGIQQGEQFLVIIPSTTWPAKNWSPEAFAAIIRRFAPRIPIVICGVPSDRELVDKIVSIAGVPVMDAVGKTKLLELAAVIAESRLVIAGDTGPLHMAIALNTPTIGLYGPSDPAMYGPLMGQHIVVKAEGCAGCHKMRCPKGRALCMSDIHPDMVIAAVESQLK